MILLYPEVAEVEKWDPKMDCFKLLRATVLLPPPQGPHEHRVQELIEEKLGEVEISHRKTIEAASGFGTR
jgi:hypothetical protein